MTATAATANRKLTSGSTTWRAKPNARRSKKLDRESRQTNWSNIFRWYRSGWGRYTQADPIGLTQSLNLYGYVEDNPLQFIDPDGLARTCVTAKAQNYIGPGALLHHIPTWPFQRNPRLFNLLYFTASCGNCESPDNIGLDTSGYTSTRTNLPLIAQAFIPDINDLQPKLEFDNRGTRKCPGSVTYAYSWRTIANFNGAMIQPGGVIASQLLYTTLKFCYDCTKCQ